MREATRVLHERRHREGRGAAARRVARDEDVVDVALRVAHVVDDRVGHALHQRLDVRRVEGLLRAVGRDAQGLAQTANGNSGVTGAMSHGLGAGEAHSIAGSSARTRVQSPPSWRRASAAWRPAYVCIFLAAVHKQDVSVGVLACPCSIATDMVRLKTIICAHKCGR